MSTHDSTLAKSSPLRLWLLAVGCLALPLLVLFAQSFQHGKVVFANDSPLGAISSQATSLPGTLFGFWQDLNWVGAEQPSGLPSFSTALYLLLKQDGPEVSVLFAKAYAPASLFMLGVCAFLFFRRLGFHSATCILGGMAALLNINVLSNAAWGLPTRALTLAAAFLALTALSSGHRQRPLLNAILAGLAVGFGLMEGYDVGAIFSLYVAAYAFYLAWNESGGVPLRAVRGVSRVLIMAICAALLAAQALSTLIGTQLKGIVEIKQEQAGAEEKWDWATQWSLPKVETLRVLIPGLFGYRLDTPNGGNYWGTVGRQPGWEVHHRGFPRHSGSGEYAGVLVCLVAAWAAAQSFRKTSSSFALPERRMVWFWSAMALLSLLLSFGRHAPFYQLIYHLPFFSTIRNPIKFMHPFHLSLLVLFGYGLEDLCRRGAQVLASRKRGWQEGLSEWWKTASRFERKWILAVGAVGVMSVLAWLAYASSRSELGRYLQANGFSEAMAAEISRFSVKEVGVFLLFYALSCGGIVLTLSRPWTGLSLKWILLFLGGLLWVDLGRAASPWIRYYDWQYKYQTNPVLDILRDRPYEHRVLLLPFQIENENLSLLQELYGIEWVQHLFQFYNIQSLDIIQEPRKTAENAAYRSNFPPTQVAALMRLWELTNTRYLLGLSGPFIDALNQQFDPKERRFQSLATFNLVPKKDRPTSLEDITAVLNTNGACAIIEFKGALPRASLFEQWQVKTNDSEALLLLANTNFNPRTTVLVAGGLPATTAPASTNTSGPKRVEYLHYAPKQLKLSAQAERSSILLLNDKYHPDWKVWVDGKPQTLLRCNFLMRGVHLEPGTHTVEFRFQPPLTALYISLGTLLAGLIVLSVLLISRQDRNLAPSPAAPESLGPKPQNS